MNKELLLIKKRYNLKEEEFNFIISSVFDKKIYQIYLSEKLPKNKIKKIINICKKRKDEIPLPYLLKKSYFLDLELFIEKGVFIPRAETELMISLLEDFNKRKIKYIIDIGVGTGNLTIALGKMFKEALIIGTDISKRALRVAKKNVEKYSLTNQIKLYYADLFYFPNYQEYFNKFDLIVSNPPYINKKDYEKLPKAVKDYEDKRALYGGEDGLLIIKRILKEGKKFLSKNGKIILEIDSHHPIKIYEYAKELYTSFIFINSLTKKIRFAIIS
ncbi:MAG: peptide chain release factor N(5)-glutamine methyltransferase [candidate division WOR-3 bacterium]|nr:peptide chain release factor N(5)-glutamine methyltransferase [candidate division WOR-3 bacterium]MCX7837556.1 peptide chain release factor N(5)-glutamine methyltransferase [candidate division WOR-3 bacterium]MDW8114051.1 HemK/PrmC family methyltransferase [candidate division WOR-3 bacterium]